MIFSSLIKKEAGSITRLFSCVYFANRPYKLSYSGGDFLIYNYDSAGNIKVIYTNNDSYSYSYDKLGRLICENNPYLGKSYFYTYDQNGNITSREECGFTTLSHTPGTGTVITYSYVNGRLTNYNGQACVYDNIGNPRVYRGHTLTWKGRQLTKYNGVMYRYDGRGRRISKGGITFTYDSEGNLIKQSNGLTFFYDCQGVAGFDYNNTIYYYRKDAQGNIIAILDNSGTAVVKYYYDAWGNHIVSGSNTTIGNLNPFRYRGYYYDTETKLYFLQTRYYDPEVGRFINMDDVDYADPTTLHGLNLYAYCGNNPVMNVDPTGHEFFTFLVLSIVVGASLGGTINGIKAYNEGQRGLGLFGAIIGGIVMGGVMGAVMAIGGAAGLSAAIAPLGLSVAGFTMTTTQALVLSIAMGVGAGAISYSLENGLRTDRTWSFGGTVRSSISGGVKALATFGIAYMGGKIGGFDKMALKPYLKGADTISDRITYEIAKSMLAELTPSIGRSFLTSSAYFIGEGLTKFIFISSLAAGARWLIDMIFGT